MVPNLPGVPALPSYAPGLGGALLVADAISGIINALRPQWGIYLNGEPVIVSSTASLLGLGSLTQAANTLASLPGLSILGLNVNAFSVVDFEYRQDWSLPTYPVEQGAFLSYNKVQLPFDVRMRVAAGGAVSNRSALLSIVQTIANDLNLYDVHTPEDVFPSCNVKHFDYIRRSNSGLGILVIDIWLMQVRVTATSSFSNTQQPGGASPTALGNVQPVTPSAQQTPSLNGVL